MSVRRPVFALCALVGLCLPVSAGPIEFSYTAAGTVTPGPFGSPSPGKITLSLDPQGNVQLPGAGGSVDLGSITLGASKPHAGIATSGFSVTVGIWDQASNTTGSLGFSGQATDAWVQSGGTWYPTDHALLFAGGSDLGSGPWTAVTQTVLGNTRYTLWADVNDDRTHADFSLTAAAATPEPGTLIMVGCGLPAAGLWLRRRRAAAG